MKVTGLMGLRRASLGLTFLLTCSSVLSASNDLDDIPPLRPPRAELPPTFWELHGTGLALAGFVLLALLGAAIWYFTRPKPPPVLSPESLARNALEPLRQQPEDGRLLSQVSQILRHYLAAAFDLPQGELTTSEFCRLLSASPRPGPELTQTVTTFLRRSDERKFAPAPPHDPLGAVPQALMFIDQAEARLAQLRAAQAAHSAPASRTT